MDLLYLENEFATTQSLIPPANQPRPNVKNNSKQGGNDLWLDPSYWPFQCPNCSTICLRFHQLSLARTKPLCAHHQTCGEVGQKNLPTVPQDRRPAACSGLSRCSSLMPLPRRLSAVAARAPLARARPALNASEKERGAGWETSATPLLRTRILLRPSRRRGRRVSRRSDSRRSPRHFLRSLSSNFRVLF